MLFIFVVIPQVENIYLLLQLLSNLTTFQVSVGLLRHLDLYLDSSDI